MLDNIKALVVVLAIALVIFRFARPIALKFSSERDFLRRRNIWFALTAAAFLSPNFWLFALVAAPLLVWAGRIDPNPAALYLLLFQVIPEIPIDIPLPGLKAFFYADNYRLLSFCVLIPAALRLRKANDPNRIRGMNGMDVCLLAWGALKIVLFIPPDSADHIILEDTFTNDLRRSFLFLVDIYVLYFVVSRTCSSRQSIVEAYVSFCLVGVLMAGIAVFESLRHWILYAGVVTQWAGHDAGALYADRNGGLRAMASAGDKLVLGYLLAIALGFWLYLMSHVASKATRIAVALLLCFGMLATYARGPWIGALVIYLSFAALGRSAMSTLLKAAGLIVLLYALIAVSPFGDRMASSLPFITTSADSQASGSILYRQRLAARSWQLMQEHPFFGDQLAYFKMQDLRQGDGIIDLINTYAEVAVFYGLVGLSLFLGLIVIALFRVYRRAREAAAPDPDLARLGLSLISSILGTLTMIATCSFILGYVILFYVLAAFGAAYAHLNRLPQANSRTRYQDGNFREIG